MKRFLLFGGDEDQFGWSAFLGDYDTLPEAVADKDVRLSAKDSSAIWQIVDQDVGLVALDGEWESSYEKQRRAHLLAQEGMPMEPEPTHGGRSGTGRMVGHEEHAA